jgi:hypothetical protein
VTREPTAQDEPASDAPAADALVAALAAEGLHCTIEARGRLAVLLGRGAGPALADPALRRRTAALAAAHGFSHVALDLSPPEDDTR